ncbi:MAG TPA: hypothetical protein PKB06_12910, partial [Actinotalea sp.]|nr:hypothetical protein [Actinotalea sp.]
MERAFRLAGLLHLRRLQEEAAAARLAEANRALHVAEEDRDALAVAMAATAFPSQADVTAWQAAAATRASLASLVDEAAVVAIPDSRSGEAVRAYVVQNPDYAGELTKDDILRHCKGLLTDYKV